MSACSGIGSVVSRLVVSWRRGSGGGEWRGFRSAVLRSLAPWRRFRGAGSVASGFVAPDATKHSLLLEGVGRPESSLRRPTDIWSGVDFVPLLRLYPPTAASWATCGLPSPVRVAVTIAASARAMRLQPGLFDAGWGRRYAVSPARSGLSRGPGRPTECTLPPSRSQAPKTQDVVVSCPPQPPYLGPEPRAAVLIRWPVDRLGMQCGRPVDRCPGAAYAAEGVTRGPGAECGCGGSIGTGVLFYNTDQKLPEAPPGDSGPQSVRLATPIRPIRRLATPARLLVAKWRGNPLLLVRRVLCNRTLPRTGKVGRFGRARARRCR